MNNDTRGTTPMETALWHVAPYMEGYLIKNINAWRAASLTAAPTNHWGRLYASEWTKDCWSNARSEINQSESSMTRTGQNDKKLWSRIILYLFDNRQKWFVSFKTNDQWSNSPEWRNIFPAFKRTSAKTTTYRTAHTCMIVHEKLQLMFRWHLRD